MKVQIEQKDLAALVSRVARAAAVTNTVPVLQSMFLEAAEGKLVAQATNLEIGVKLATGEIQPHEDGKILVNAKNFETFVKNLPSGVITLETSGNMLMVKYGRSKANLNLVTDADYPGFPKCTDEILTLPAAELKKAITLVSPAVAKTHFRQVFTGVLIDIQEEKTAFVASDTHRLNILEVEHGGKPQQIIIPSRTADELLRIGDDEVTFFSDGNNLLIKAGDTEISSRMINGQYPNYEQVIPKAFVTEVVAPTTELKQSLQRLLSLPQSKDKVPVTRVTLNGAAEITATADGAGEIKEYLDIQKNGEDLEVFFNAEYFLGAVKLMPDETRICFSGQVTPAMLTGTDGFRSVLVPLRVNAGD